MAAQWQQWKRSGSAADAQRPGGVKTTLLYIIGLSGFCVGLPALIEWLYLLRSAKLCVLWTAQAFICANKTVRIETYTSRFGGTFFLQPDRPCFFSEPRREKQKTKIRHTEPGRYDGRQRLWLFLLPVGRPRPFCSRARVYRAMGDAPYRRRHENRAGGGV